MKKPVQLWAGFFNGILMLTQLLYFELAHDFPVNFAAYSHFL